MKTRKPEKIIYLITDLRIGGAQRVLSNILPHLDRRKFDPIVVCLFAGEGPIAEEITKTGIPVIDLQMMNKIDVFAVWRFYKLLNREKPSILHSALFHANILSRVVGRLAKVPVIITWRHNINLGNDLREWVKKATSKLDDCVIVVSNAVKEREINASGANNKKVIVVYNGIDTSLYRKLNNGERRKGRNLWGIPENTYLIGSVGRLHFQKGYEILLHAFKRIKRIIPNAWLMIVGEGELRKYLEETAQNLEISDYVVFTGTVTHISEILGILDVFVLSSRWEGFPLVILEAMASQLPVVATCVGGVPEIISNNHTGYLIQPNSVEDIVNMLTKIYQDINLADRIAKAGREKIKSEFDVIQIADQIQNLYTDLLNSRQ